MTMYRGSKMIAAAQFKARCLQLLDEVARTRKSVVITKRGRPLARLVPLEPEVPLSLEGSVSYGGDIVGPTGEEWDAER
jgi:prevent-host-death family protein